MRYDPIFFNGEIPSTSLGSLYSERLMRLHTARRLLLVRIVDESRLGMPTADLEAELATNRAETKTFLAFVATIG
jgi:hypothetical protein